MKEKTDEQAKEVKREKPERSGFKEETRTNT